MAYIIQLSNGTTIPSQHSARAPFGTYQEAVDACEREWPDCEIFRDGVNALVWSCLDDSIDDDGANAMASIVEVAS